MDDPPSTTFAIDVSVREDAWIAAFGSEVVLEREIRRACAAVFAEEASGDAQSDHEVEISVVLCDDDTIAALNAEWRGKHAPTNVLSFPAPPEIQRFMLGDIVIAFGTSAREADAAGVALPDYLAHLVVHGLYHLLGHDHDRDDDAEAMEAAEGRALARLGLASPYVTAHANADDREAVGRQMGQL